MSFTFEGGHLRRLLASYLLLILISSLSDHKLVLASVQEYYAQLPRWGPIKGTRLTQIGSPQPQVIGFLGLSYAAAPIGPLRLMPPGAHLAPKTSVNPPEVEQSLLMPSGRLAPVRTHDKFGKRCVRLADWLQNPAEVGPRANGTTNKRSQTPDDQSEDCLNLNAFVPVRDSMTTATTNTSTTTQITKQQQIKSNQSSDKQQADNRNSINQDDTHEPGTKQLWPIQQHTLDFLRPLPIVVVFQTHQVANNDNYLTLVQRLHSIVVTFNHRFGLLGFLPSSEPADSNSTRNNHALWDQIGLLHWLRHNGAAFNGDPHNVTLMALDNGASLYVQLLALSPLAKGLFNRIVLVGSGDTDDAQNNSLDKLLNLAADARDSRRRLTAHLIQIVDKISPNNSPEGQKVSEFIQSANLSQLAMMERELIALKSDNLLALVREPTLDDKLLFPPYLQNLIRLRQFDPVVSFANYTKRSARLNYCLYVSQLNSLGPDPLNLVASETSGLQELQNFNVLVSDLRNSTGKSVSRLMSLSQAGEIFNHLWNTHKLYDLINKLGDSGTSHTSRVGRQQLQQLMASDTLEILNEDDEDDEDDANFMSRKQQDRSLVINQNHPNIRKVIKRQPSQLEKRSANRFGSRVKGGEFEQLLEQLASFDLMVVAMRHSPDGNLKDEIDANANQIKTGKFPNIVQAIMNVSSRNAVAGEQQLISLLKFADLHSIASWTSDEEVISNLCDFSVRNNNLDVIPMPAKSSLALMLINEGKCDTENCLIESIQNEPIAQKFQHFIRLPNEPQAGTKTSNWRPYNSLNRNIQLIRGSVPKNSSIIQSNPTETKSQSAELFPHIDQLMSIKLDLIPYLIHSLNIVEDKKSSIKQSELIESLLVCLNELDSLLLKIPLAYSELLVSEQRNGLQNLGRIQEESKCLANSLGKLRSKLRQIASNDFEMLSLRLQKYHQSKQQARQQQLESARSSPIQSGDLINDGFYSNNNSNDLSESTSSNNSSMILVARDSSQRAIGQQRTLVSNTTDTTVSGKANSSSSFKGFFAKAYKDAVGKALAIVVGTGLFIFLLNLIIVLIITLKSASARRQAARSIQDSSAVQNNDLITPLANGHLTQDTNLTGTIKKSTLKKPNGASLISENSNNFCVVGYQNAETDLTSTGSVKSSFASSQATGQKRRLKFDLSGVPTKEQDDVSRQDEVGLNQMQQHQVFLMNSMNVSPQLDQQLASSSNSDNEFVLSAPQLLQLNHSLSSNFYGNQANEKMNDYDEYILHNHQVDCNNCTPMITDLSSPFASISATNSNVTVESTLQQRASNQSQYRMAQNYFQLAPGHSVNSPGSSTSHSMTPIQLESYVTGNGTTTTTTTTSEMSPRQQTYQLEHIGLLYPAYLVDQ